MRRALPVLIVLTFLVLACAVHRAPAAPNPFTSAPQAAPAKQVEHSLTSPLAPVLREIIGWQNTLREQMSRAAMAIHKDPLGPAFWLFMWLAFAYGAAHALGPGHGKVLAISYFIHRDGSARQALFLGYLSMVLHVCSATILVLVGKFLLQISASRAVDDMGRLLSEVSYGLLAVVGVVMLLAALRQCLFAPEPVQCPADPGDLKPLPGSWKGLCALALATGMVPCPGAALVLIFSISLGITVTGLAAMVAISLGMGLCLTLVSLLAMKFRSAMLGCMGSRPGWLRVARCSFSLLGALVLTAVGVLMLMGSVLGRFVG